MGEGLVSNPVANSGTVSLGAPRTPASRGVASPMCQPTHMDWLIRHVDHEYVAHAYAMISLPSMGCVPMFVR